MKGELPLLEEILASFLSVRPYIRFTYLKTPYALSFSMSDMESKTVVVDGHGNSHEAFSCPTIGCCGSRENPATMLDLVTHAIALWEKNYG